MTIEGQEQPQKEHNGNQVLDIPIPQMPVTAQKGGPETTSVVSHVSDELHQTTSDSDRHQIVPKRMIHILLDGILKNYHTYKVKFLKLNPTIGLLPFLAMTNAFGLLIIACSYYLSVEQYGVYVLEGLFLAGLSIMLVPDFLRLLSAKPARLERISLLLMLGICFYCVFFMTSPLHVSWYDEFLHWRTVSDILGTKHLFSVNSMLPTSPYYAGLEIVTDAICTTTGLSPFYAGVIVILIARVIIILALFLLYEHITGSSRMASIAVLIYMTNPHFLLFDSLFSYETLALPLAMFLFYILVRFQITNKEQRGIVAMAWIVLAAVALTHHMTDYVSIGLLLLWTLVSLLRPVAWQTRIHLAAISLFGLLFALMYAFLMRGNPVWGYLSEYFGGTFNELAHIITRTGSARTLFSGTDQVSPLWDRLLMMASVGIITCCLPFGLLCLIRTKRQSAFLIVLGLFSLLYPLTQAFRFTQFGAEITDRAAAFLYLPISYILVLLLTYFWSPPIHSPKKRLGWIITFLLSAGGDDTARRLRQRTTLFITCALAIVFLGSVILALGTNLSGLPGPYIVEADARSVGPEGIEAAKWSLLALGSGNPIGTDRINQMLMSTYGNQRIITNLNDKVDISPLFFSSQFSSDDRAIIQYTQIRYLVVDLRMSNALPLNGFYFESDQPKSPIPKEVLTKFDTIPQINRFFDSGNIVIYDVRGLDNG